MPKRARMSGASPTEPQARTSWPTSVRLTTGGNWIVERLIEKWGVSRTAVLEMAVRQLGEREGLNLVKKQAA